MLNHSPTPWSYEYNPYQTSDGKEIPAFEVFDNDLNKIADTNEDSPSELQEKNARLMASAPELLEALKRAAESLRIASETFGSEKLLSDCMEALAVATRAEGGAQ